MNAWTVGLAGGLLEGAPIRLANAEECPSKRRHPTWEVLSENWQCFSDSGVGKNLKEINLGRC
jgi:hypothetical protein